MKPRWQILCTTAGRHFSAAPRLMARDYADAVTSLNTLQSNHAIIEAIRKSGQKLNENAITEMVGWLKKVGYEPVDLNKLSAIHIAGTKGKGSTAAFTSSILKHYFNGQQTADESKVKKVGLYTSPHLRFVRERIQIDGRPLSEDVFARYFFETWDKLEHAAREGGGHGLEDRKKPVYFRFLTLMAFHTFLSEQVSAAVIECGIGGAFDSTNILDQSRVTGITNLGIDHVGMLGDTIGQIAWHKAGIMRRGVKCLTPSSQPSAAKEVLEQVAQKKESELVYVDIHPAIASGKVKLGLEADFQRVNASLAVAMSEEWLRSMGYPISDQSQEIDPRFQAGLREVQWGGRCETRIESSSLTWYIDGGHTLESITLAGKWYAQQLSQRGQRDRARSARYLIFNQQIRDADALAKALHTTLIDALKVDDGVPFTHAVFCTNTSFRDSDRPDLVSSNTNKSDMDDLRVQKQLAKTWATIDPSCKVEVVRTVEEAVAIVRKQADAGDDVTALVTGSLHLVGSLLEVLDSSGSTT